MKIRNNAAVHFVMYVLSIAGIFFLSPISNFAQEKSETKLAKQAKISREKAREIAQAKEPNGTIEDSELEKEHGKLVYSFDIRNPKGTITEVQVDAKTGAIVSVEEENKQAEAKEKQEDAKKRRNTKQSGPALDFINLRAGDNNDLSLARNYSA